MEIINSPLIIILGPTAVGKTELSLRVAEKLGGEIISSDSRLFYRGMDIGTAKPTRQEQLRVKHHLIDILDPDQICSLSVFQSMVKEAIFDIQQRGKLPIIVGGSGQYIQALVEDWQPPEQAPYPELRNILEKWSLEIGVFELHKRLGILDPIAAQNIQPQNLRRTIRALEVIFQTGKKFSGQRNKGISPYRLFQVGLMRTRENLYKRIDNRILGMLENGLVNEVKKMLDKGYSPHLPSMSAIGYKEIASFLTGEIELEDAIMLIKRQTRQFVRRQANWFKITNPDIHWYYPEKIGNNELENIIEKEIADFLK